MLGGSAADAAVPGRRGRRPAAGSEQPRREDAPDGADRLVVGSLFSGIGLLDYGLHLAGFEHAWFCERDSFRRAVLVRRWPGIPVWDDVTALADAAEFTEREQADAAHACTGGGAARPLALGGVRRVDLVAGGFPCKGVSHAGRRQGFGHPETALWRQMLRIVRALRPRYVLVENVAALLRLHDGELFGEVLGGLAESGYSAEWDCFPASAFGAPHRRDRVFVTASRDADGEGLADGGRLPRLAADGRERALADAERGVHAYTGRGDVPGEAGAGEGSGPERQRLRADAADAGGVAVEWGGYEPAIRRWEDILGRAAPEPLVRRMDDGSTGRVDRSRLSALGDGVLVQAGWLCGMRILEHAQETPDP